MTAVAETVTTKVVGFFEEAPGVKSSKRLNAIVLIALAGVVVLTECGLAVLVVTGKVTIDVAKFSTAGTVLNATLLQLLGGSTANVFRSKPCGGGNPG